jgi:Big-like domain-containing protein
LPRPLLTYMLMATNQANGTLITNVTINTDGIITWTPTETQGPGTNRLTTIVSDGTRKATNSFLVTIVEANNAPQPGGLNITLLEDATTNLVLTATDADLPPNTLTYSIVNVPTNGALSNFNTNSGALTYTPNPNYNGPDTIRYRVSDGSLFATGLVTLAVMPVNDPPFATNFSLTAVEDAVTNFTLLGSDLESGRTFSIVSTPTNGTLLNFNTNNGAIAYQPNPNFNGFDSFRFRVSDGALLATGQVSITVSPVNDQPVAGNDNFIAGALASLTVAAPGVLTNDVDLEGTPLAAVLVTPPAQGTLVLNVNGSFTYTPTNHFSGEDTFTYRAFDGLTSSAPATVSISVANEFRITSLKITNNLATVDWTSITGKMYQLQYSDQISGGTWNNVSLGVMATGPTTSLTNATGNSARRFYRVKLLTAAPSPEIKLIRLTNGVATVTFTAVPGQAYRLQYATNLTSSPWTDLPQSVLATGSMAAGTNATGGATQRYYRVRLGP